MSAYAEWKAGFITDEEYAHDQGQTDLLLAHVANGTNPKTGELIAKENSNG